jgi:hypothetical protein
MKKPPTDATAKKSTRSKASQYTSMVVKGETYSIGSVAYVKEFNDAECIATIESLSQKPGAVPQVKIRWFYKPSDVFPDPAPCFSKREFFDSDHRQVVDSDCLNGVARVVNFDEFFTCDCIDPDLYFSRATYQATKRTLCPPVSAWPRVCSCKEVANPDLTYKKCLGCGEAYHVECLDSTICPQCHSSDLIDYDYVLLVYSDPEE